MSVLCCAVSPAGQMNTTLRAGLSLPDMIGMLIYMHPTLPRFVAALAELDPVVPELPGMCTRPDRDGSFDSSIRSSYFASLRQASFAGVSTIHGISFSSRVGSHTSQDSSFGSRVDSQSSLATKSGSTMVSAFATVQQSPQMSTVFSGAEAGSSPGCGLFKQLSRNLGRALSASKDQQGADSELGALPVAVLPAGAAQDSLTNKLTRVLSTESMSFRTMLSGGIDAADADRLPITAADKGGLNRGSGSLGGKWPSFNFDGPSKTDQDRRISRSSSVTAKDSAGWEADAGVVDQAQQVKPSLALATFLQLVCMCTVTGVSGVLTLAPMLISMYLMLVAGWRTLVLLPIFELGGWLLVAVWAVGGKWLLVGRYVSRE